MIQVSRAARWLGATGFAVFALGAMASTASAQTVLRGCGPLVSGNYVLGRNIAAEGDCFTLMGENVAIDFKGKTLTGDGTGSGITDGAAARNFAAFHNGKIRNFATGIDLGSSGNASLNKMDVSKNVGSGIQIGNCCNTLNGVKVNDNGGDGAELLGCCHSVTKSSAAKNGGAGFDMQGCCSVFNSGKSTDNAAEGITMTGCCNSVDASTIAGNGGTGVRSTGSSSFLTDSKVQKNGGDGVFMDGCCNSVNKCTVTSNGGNGVTLENGNNQVTASKVNKNAGVGIEMDDDTGNRITSSQANENDTGASVLCPGVVVDFKAKKNPSGNLLEDTIGGDCTNLGNKAQ